MPKVTTTYKPPPGLDEVRKMATRKVVVGVLGAKAAEAHEEGGGSVVNVATIHEFGAPEANIPERSFLRPIVKDPELKAFVLGRVRRVAAGKATADQADDEIGLKARAMVQARMRAGIDPPLKRPRTRTKTQRAKDLRLKKKGLPVPKKKEIPLIDSGQTIGAITYEVRRK